jgi:hypothetical protein
MPAYILRHPMLVCIACLSGNLLIAQMKTLPKWEAGPLAGAYIYQGDLTPQRIGSLKTIRMGWGIQVTRILSNAFSLHASFVMAKLSGDESRYSKPAYRQERNFAFTTPLKELTLKFQYSLLQSNYDERKFEPYAFAGAILGLVRINRDYSRLNTIVFGEASDVQVGLAADMAKKTPHLIPAIPAGLGLKYNINERFAVNTEFTYRFMYTDYLDGFSKSANPKLNDHYISQTAGLIYKFGKKNSDYFKCPGY